MCNGDVSLVTWWNKTYTYTDEKGNEQLSQAYLNMSPKERTKNSYVSWDVKTRCHDMDAITAWTEENQIGGNVTASDLDD